MHTHNYQTTVNWTGNSGNGTASYKGYERSHTIVVEGKPTLPGSSDPSFRGDKSRYNPEELLVASLSACHMLFFLHICAITGVVVTEYTDRAEGKMIETDDGSGHFTEVTLKPQVTVKENDMIEKTHHAHEEAARLCFIANSVKFPVHHKPYCISEKDVNGKNGSTQAIR